MMKRKPFQMAIIALTLAEAFLVWSRFYPIVSKRFSPALQSSSPRTAEPDHKLEPFTFCVIADPLCREGVAKGDQALGNGAARFIRCFEKIRSLSEQDQPDFALVLGDLHVDVFEKLLGDLKKGAGTFFEFRLSA